MYRDCHVNCWEGDHLIYVPIAIGSLHIFIPTSIWTRPRWQDFDENLNIEQLPAFLIMKNVVRIILIVCSKTLFRKDEVLHAFVFIAIMIAYIAFNYRVKAYNYERVQFWHIMSLFAILWLAFILLMKLILKADKNELLAYILLINVGWGVMIIYGVYYQHTRLPSLLFQPGRRNTNVVFQFALRFFRDKEEEQRLVRIIDIQSRPTHRLGRRGSDLINAA